jgi:aldehyde:ferredoxin oxidoreductase
MQKSEYDYTQGKIEKGYNNRTLYINLGSGEIKEKEVDQRMKDIFIGGRGFDLWLLWSSLPKDRITKWDDPENEICISSGPLGGTPLYPGSGKSIVVSISPLTHSIMDSNVGGYFGPYLKFAGFDALELQGKADSDVIIFIDGVESKITIHEMDGLPTDGYALSQHLTKHFGGENPRSISVVSAGPGADHTYFGCLNFSWYDSPRKRVRYKQAGRGGIGTVFRNKKIKAIVARAPKFDANTNAPADTPSLQEAGRFHSGEIRELDSKQNEMAVLGTTHITPIMNDFDLLPTCNYRFGKHEDAGNLHAEVYRKKFDKGFDGCWVGCTVACAHGVKDFTPRSGPYKGQPVFVDGPEYETIAGCGSNCGIFDPDYVIESNFYCDAYGIDTISVGTGMAFAMECYENGILDKEKTGGLELNFGNIDAALELHHQMARGEGFGLIFGKGIRYMKKYFADNFGADAAFLQDIGMESKGLEFSEYMTKESLAQQGGYGLALKGPQHDEAWLIFLDMVHNLMPTFEQKAENLHWFPMWRTWFGINGLCKLPWNDIVPEDNKDSAEPAKVMKHVDSYAKYFSAVTGRQAGADDLIKMSEKVYNFQRIFNLRLGFGKRAQDQIPYRAVGPVTEEEYLSRQERYDGQLKELLGLDPAGMSTQDKMAKLREYREAQYVKLADAVYERRGWTQDGVPKLEKVREMGIDFPDVVELLEKHQ